MAIQWMAGDTFTCLSSDTKPTLIPANTKAIETDTDDTYKFNGTSWVLFSGGGGAGALTATSTTTLTNKTISNDSNTFPYLGPYNAIIYKSGTVYKSKKSDGTLLASSTTLDGVVQAALDVAGTVLWPGAADGSNYTPSSAAAWKIYPDTKLIMGAWITVPGGYANSLFTVDDTTGGAHVGERIYVQGGFIQESSGTPQVLWTGLDIKSTSSASGNAGVTFCTFRDMFIKRCGVGVKLTCNAGAESFISGCTFDSITVNVPRVGFEFAAPGTGSVQVASRNTFINCIAQADQTQPTGPLAMSHGFKNISNKNNAFFHCKGWDVISPNVCSNITSTAEDTIIIGGLMTYQPYDWEVSQDLGERTWVYADPVVLGSGGLGSNAGIINPFMRKTGTFMGAGSRAANTVVGEGLLGVLKEDGTLSNSLTTSGAAKRMDTGATANTQAAIRGGTSSSARYFSPLIKTRFKLNQTTAQRVFFGFSSGVVTMATADDPLVSQSGYGLYHSTTSGVSATNWIIVKNDGAASSTMAVTARAANVTTVQDLIIAGWEDGPLWEYRIGTNAMVSSAASSAPAQLTGLLPGIWISNPAGASKTCDVFGMFLKHGKAEA